MTSTPTQINGGRQIQSGTITGTQISSSPTIAVTQIINGTNLAQLSQYISKEIPSGLMNGSNVTFTLANAPYAGSEELKLNGLVQMVGASYDYTISGTTITYNIAPLATDLLQASYWI